MTSTTSSQVKFLESVFAPGDTIMLRPVEVWTEAGRRRSQVDYKGVGHLLYGIKDASGGWQPSAVVIQSKLDSANRRAAQERANLFFGVAPRFVGGGSFDKSWQIRRVNCLWADVDNCQPDDCLRRCKEAGLPEPTVLVNSGSGCHVYWRLVEPYLIDDVGNPLPVHQEWVENGDGKKCQEYIVDPQSGERLYLGAAKQNTPSLSEKAQHVQDVLSAIGEKVGGDHVQDLARVLRIAPSWNYKNARNGQEPKPCEIIFAEPEKRYPFSDFESLVHTSEAAGRRKRIAQVPLPQRQRMTTKRREKLDQLLVACAAAEPGERSEHDFHFCCAAIELGLTETEAWGLAGGVGRFLESGERYFGRTWEAAAQHVQESRFAKSIKRTERPAESKVDENGPLGNALVTYDGDAEVITPLPMTSVIAAILDRTENWPRRVGTNLFVESAGEGRLIHWFESPPSLFGWLADRCGAVEWRRSLGCVTKDETYCQLTRSATSYTAVEQLPHEPPIRGHHYACGTPEPGGGAALRQLLDFFCLETELDRQLLTTAFLSPLWGGPPGSRPAFLLTAKGGRGKGKSKMAQAVARLYRGSIDISHREDFGVVKQRLLSPEALSKRILLLDNIKSPKFSWAELEGLLTAAEVSGKRMYSGEGTRPNRLTMLLTLNGVSLSTDMSQRTVEIRLREPDYGTSWEEELFAFIEAHRPAIIGDLIGLLRGPRLVPQQKFRWATWQREVLACVESPAACLDVILARQGEVDAEREEGEILQDYFASQIASLDYDPDRDDVFIPNAITTLWCNRALNDHAKTTTVTQKLRQLHDEKKVWKIVPYRVGHAGKGFRWVGEHAAGGDVTHYDLKVRLAKKNENSPTEKNSWSDEF
ncbi:MAG TPA: hypothetical protein VMY42_22525 [Thermoguttaceae bacterium]|nr:hypothetical protein [Thermoguttaceae bacterium]